MDFGSVGAALGMGECLIALVHFSLLTSTFLASNLRSERGVGTTQVEGFMPARELLLRGCSRGLTCMLVRGESLETVSADAVSETDVHSLGLVIVGLRAGRGSRAAFGVLISSPRGAGREPGINELGLTEERVS